MGQLEDLTDRGAEQQLEKKRGLVPRLKAWIRETLAILLWAYFITKLFASSHPTLL